jgi:hypothetical protein
MKHSLIKLFIPAVILIFFAVGISSAQTPHIEIVPMSALLKSDLGLGNEFFVSAGLQNVGKGEHIYLRAVDRNGKDITAYTWEITAKPAGSEAELLNAAEDVYYMVADAVGQYTVKLSITTEDGTQETERIVSANLYLGAGGVGGVVTTFPQCGLCHGPIRDQWINTDHATIFKRGIDGEVPGFGATRQRTATTGLAEVDLESGSFFSLKAETEWEFPNPPAAGTFDQLVQDHPNLAQVATIGCEACHGAGSLHPAAAGNKNLMKANYTSESCASCHDAARPSAQFHSFRRSAHTNAVWSNSFRQAAASQNNNLQNCARCHDGRAYVNFTKGLTTNTTAGEYEQVNHVTVTCETCHDPHEGGLRKAPAAGDTLSGGFAYDLSIFGEAATCTDCHKYRSDGTHNTLNVPITNVRWGPHYGGATDIMLGRTGYHFETEMPTSMAHLHQGNACVDCHMSTADGAFRNLLGDHSWKMKYTDDEGQTRHLVEACQSCHPGINSFADIKGADYNNSGVVQPFVDEVQGLLTMLAESLPPVGEPTIDWQQIDNDNLDMKGAYWNYRLVYYDHSLGIHNPKYVVALLQRSIERIRTDIRFENTPDIPREFALAQNYPNPFNPTTQIQFSIPEQAQVSLTIYDITGREVTELVNEALGTGTYTATWDGRNANGQIVSSGLYLYRIQALAPMGGTFVQTKRMVFIK